MTPFIRVNQLIQRFGSQEVLKGVSFTVNRGEFVALIGGSGAGKSVLLKHLNGLLDPLSGTVEIDGTCISHASPKVKNALRKKMGFMFQQGALFDSMSVGENIAFPLRESGIKDERELDARVAAALESVGLTGHVDKMPADLSGGMIKRVAVARAMVMMPECLLYDEPTAGLDPIVTDSISTLMRKICTERGITTVLVSHDMPGIVRIADRVIYLKDGKVYWQGTPERLLQNTDRVIMRFLYGEAESPEETNSKDHLANQFQQELLQRALQSR